MYCKRKLSLLKFECEPRLWAHFRLYISYLLWFLLFFLLLLTFFNMDLIFDRARFFRLLLLLPGPPLQNAPLIAVSHLRPVLFLQAAPPSDLKQAYLIPSLPEPSKWSPHCKESRQHNVSKSRVHRIYFHTVVVVQNYWRTQEVQWRQMLTKKQ